MEKTVIKSLSQELSTRGINLDGSEIDYIGSVVSEILQENAKVVISRISAKELCDEIVDVILPILSECITEDTENQVFLVAVAMIDGARPGSRDLLLFDKNGVPASSELPLLDFPDFSLAYMGLELLRHASLTVYRGKIYGIIGRNGIGKTTLLNKLANGEVPGFPKNVKCGIVRHELVGSFELMTPREIIKDVKTLQAVGFVEQHASLADVVCSDLSGGWRMRTSIGHTIAGGDLDLLLMDEPTNHLDRECVAWLIGFLKGLKNVAAVIISHDEEFLNKTVNYILYFYNFKLKLVESNFTDFVQSEILNPVTLAPLNEASNNTVIAPPAQPFILPKPGSLDGIRSTSQTIAKLEDVSFTYPVGASGRVAGVYGISGRICLSSRIALVGPNGAGKSTIASLLVGAQTPFSGTVFRHLNLRIAHVSQHHVHHLEEVMHKTCIFYFVDRFGSGLDKEIMTLESIKETKYEQLDRVGKAKKFADKCDGRSARGGVQCLLGRRKEGKEYAYEVQWIGVRSDKTNWLPRSVLEQELGVGKLCSAMDSVIAQKKAGTDQRGLDFNSIKAYLRNFGILPHTAEGKIAGLSGGQKSRLTLAAAMWTYPHMLILDEPTNYLDSASLDSLLDAVTNFRGAVIVISHNAPFVDRFAREKWVVEAGRIVKTEKNGSDDRDFNDELVQTLSP